MKLQAGELMPHRARHALYWLAILGVLVLMIAALSDILLPFVAGLVIAYMLNPLVAGLERRGLTRSLAAILVVSVGVVAVGLLAVILVPLLVDQLRGLMANMPKILEALRSQIDTLAGRWLPGGTSQSRELLQQIFGEASQNGGARIAAIAQSLLSGGLALVNFLSLLLITPVVAFYLLLDWDDLVVRVDSWLPRDHAATIRRLAGEVDAVINGFLRGQTLVCLILGLIYAVGLSWIGLDYALLVGFAAGLLSFIPFVGTLTGLAIGSMMALAQFWPDWVSILMVLGVFVFGQLLEGNILSPRIVGQSVRLHPVWLIFALFVFGYLFGFVGMLVAVPVAAAIGVLVRFTLAEYLGSELYLGGAGVEGFRTAETEPAKTGSAKTGSAKTGPAKTGPTEFGPTEIGEAGSDRAGAGEDAGSQSRNEQASTNAGSSGSRQPPPAGAHGKSTPPTSGRSKTRRRR